MDNHRGHVKKNNRIQVSGKQSTFAQNGDHVFSRNIHCVLLAGSRVRVSAHEISDTVTQLLMLMRSRKLLCIQYIRKRCWRISMQVLCAHHAHGSHLEIWAKNMLFQVKLKYRVFRTVG